DQGGEIDDDVAVAGRGVTDVDRAAALDGELLTVEVDDAGERERVGGGVGVDRRAAVEGDSAGHSHGAVRVHQPQGADVPRGHAQADQFGRPVAIELQRDVGVERADRAVEFERRVVHDVHGATGAQGVGVAGGQDGVRGVDRHPAGEGVAGGQRNPAGPGDGQ